MFTRLEIPNFRGFRKFHIPQLDRINLLTGRNNCGKTTLLEAFFLLCGSGNPHMALNSNVVRGFDDVPGPSIADTIWRPLFHSFDVSQPIVVKGRHSRFGLLSLRVTLEREESIVVPLSQPESESVPDVSRYNALSFRFKKGTKSTSGRIRLTADGVNIEPPDEKPLFRAVFLSSINRNPTQDAVRLGRLRKRKQGDLVLDTLKIIEPRLQHIEDNSASGAPMIWGDVGLPELIPLPAMGDGMARIARLILAISDAPNGVVFVDEIENGLHHSVLSRVWSAVNAASIQFNTQVIASTHSYECLEAAGKSLAGDDFVLHRLESHKETLRCVTYQKDEVAAAFLHQLEVR